MAKEVKKVPMKKRGSSKDHSVKKGDSDKPKSEKKDVKQSKHPVEHSKEKHTDSAEKQSAKVHSHASKQKRRKPKAWVPRVAFILLLVAALGLFVHEEFGLDLADDRGPVAATVNSQRIFASEVEDHYDQIPQEARAEITRDVVLDQIITQEVLVQRAEEIGVEIPDDEMDAEISDAIAETGWDEDQFSDVLEGQGMSVDDFRDLYRVSLVIDRLIEQEVFDTMNISDEEVREFYEDNIDRYTPDGDEIHASHILLSTDEMSEEDALELAEELVERARDGEDFSELVLEYSQDPTASQNEGDLGWITRGMMVPEFEEFIFSEETENDVYEPVLTEFGYHVVKVHDTSEEGTTPEFEEIEDRVREDLTVEYQQLEVQEYIRQLREDADIVREEVDEIDIPETPQPQQPQQPAGDAPVDDGAIAGDDIEVEIQ